MTDVVITRREFTDAIHAGIHAAGMHGEEAAALVTVARTAKRAGRVSFYECPLTLAGLGGLLESSGFNRGWKFIDSYDVTMHEIVGPVRSFEVIDDA